MSETFKKSQMFELFDVSAEWCGWIANKSIVNKNLQIHNFFRHNNLVEFSEITIRIYHYAEEWILSHVFCLILIMKYKKEPPFSLAINDFCYYVIIV